MRDPLLASNTTWCPKCLLSKIFINIFKPNFCAKICHWEKYLWPQNCSTLKLHSYREWSFKYFVTKSKYILYWIIWPLQNCVYFGNGQQKLSRSSTCIYLKTLSKHKYRHHKNKTSQEVILSAPRKCHTDASNLFTNWSRTQPQHKRVTFLINAGAMQVRQSCVRASTGAVMW